MFQTGMGEALIVALNLFIMLITLLIPAAALVVLLRLYRRMDRVEEKVDSIQCELKQGR